MHLWLLEYYLRLLSLLLVLQEIEVFLLLLYLILNNKISLLLLLQFRLCLLCTTKLNW